MKKYEKIYNRLKETLTDAEIADAYLIPEDLTPEEKAKSDAELSAYLYKLRHCPSCNVDRNSLREYGDFRYACDKCKLYFEYGKWYHVACDEYHQHTKECMVEYNV